jgi:hypothetical protein
MAKAALTRETAAAMPGTATAFSDTHVALRGISHTYPARAGHGAVACSARSISISGAASSSA